MDEYKDSEFIIGLVGAVGTDLNKVAEVISDKLKAYNYKSNIINVTRDILAKHTEKSAPSDEYERITYFMDLGNRLRSECSNGFLGDAVADIIHESRPSTAKGGPGPLPRRVHIVKSLKHENEVRSLRAIYNHGFYLFGVYADEERRKKNLEGKNMSPIKAESLIKRDEVELEGHGQHTRDTFHLSDFFIDYNDNLDKLKANIDRAISLIFGSPYISPTFGEYAMFSAYVTSLRSADLSRQIGAAICKDNQVLATGVNDCPRFGGGLYWMEYSQEENNYYDDERGRDYTREEGDPNKLEFRRIAEDILTKLKRARTEDNYELLRKTKLGGLTEYARVVHAEMEAISMCARNNISCKDAEIYVTTFPCHHCAKHIVSSGIKKIVYIEPYPKSKTFEFFDDSISKNAIDRDKKVICIPFFGVGPKRFIEMFSMDYSYLRKRVRKRTDGTILGFTPGKAEMRNPMLPSTYIEREALRSKEYYSQLKNREEKANANIN